MPRSLRISTRRIGLIWASTLRGSTQPEKRSSPASTLRQTLVSPITFKRTSPNIANLKAYQACVHGNTRTIKRRAFRETPRVQRLVLHEGVREPTATASRSMFLLELLADSPLSILTGPCFCMKTKLYAPVWGVLLVSW